MIVILHVPHRVFVNQVLPILVLVFALFHKHLLQHLSVQVPLLATATVVRGLCVRHLRVEEFLGVYQEALVAESQVVHLAELRVMVEAPQAQRVEVPQEQRVEGRLVGQREMVEERVVRTVLTLRMQEYPAVVIRVAQVVIQEDLVELGGPAEVLSLLMHPGHSSLLVRRVRLLQQVRQHLDLHQLLPLLQPPTLRGLLRVHLLRLLLLPGTQQAQGHPPQQEPALQSLWRVRLMRIVERILQ